MASDKVTTIVKDNFDQEVLNSDVPVLVDFWAQWCGPCRAVGPIIDELAEEYDGKISVGKVNVDEAGELASQFRVMSIPTIILFKDGEIAEKIIGVRTKEDFKAIIDKNL
jgi:thioredoxin 1